MTLAFLIIGLLYLVAVRVLVFLLNRPPLSPIVADRELELALVVVARNEERTLPFLLSSLQALDLNKCRLTLHLVDDCSSDATVFLVEHFQKQSPFPVRLYQSAEHLGKVAQLKSLLPTLTTEVILLTDADCRLPVGWLQAVRLWFQTEKGILGGAILPEASSRFQLMDWLLISGFGAVLSGHNSAQSAFGGNLAIDSTSLQQIDYAATILNDSAEDLQLVQRALELAIPVSIQLRPDLLVRTTALPWRRYLQQKLRWLEGLRYLRPSTRLALSGFASLQLLAAVSVIKLPVLAPLLAGVTIGNLLLFRAFSSSVGIRLSLLSVLLYPFYWTILLLGLARGLFTLPDDWGRRR